METKRVLKRILVLVLVFLITFNLIQRNHVKADTGDAIANRVEIGGYNQSNWNSLQDNGTVTTDPSSGKPQVKKIKDSFSLGKTASKIIAIFIIFIPVVLHILMTACICDGEGHAEVFTIAGTISGEYNLFDINFWEYTEKYEKGDKSITDSIKESVANWYVGTRNLAAILMILIALYIGIRMAISTVAEEQARYKSMFISWIKGVAYLVILHYMMMGIIMLSNIVVDIFVKLDVQAKGEVLEEGIAEEVLKNACLFGGADGKTTDVLSTYGEDHPIYSAITYLVIVVVYFKYFKLYLYRMLKVMFLVIISPLICATYAIDKIGDNRSQAFDHFFDEFITLVLKQPVHLFLYMIFIASAGNLFAKSHLLLMVFLFAMTSMEKVIEKMILRSKAQLVRGINEMKLKD